MTYMRTVVVYKRCRFKDANLVFIRSSNLSSICGTINTTDANVVVYSSRNDLHTLESTCQYHNITAGSIRLKTKHKLNSQHSTTCLLYTSRCV